MSVEKAKGLVIMRIEDDWEKFYCDEHNEWCWDYCPKCAEGIPSDKAVQNEIGDEFE